MVSVSKFLPHYLVIPETKINEEFPNYSFLLRTIIFWERTDI